MHMLERELAAAGRRRDPAARAPAQGVRRSARSASAGMAFFQGKRAPSTSLESSYEESSAIWISACRLYERRDDNV
jgi:hypothetical protein